MTYSLNLLNDLLEVNDPDDDLIENWKHGLHSISQQEYLNIYNYFFENSLRHLNIGRILADNNEFGNAISHLVLATEEAVKGTIIFAEGKGFNLRSNVKGFNKFFTDHKIRHEFASYIYSIISNVEIFMRILGIKKNQYVPNPLEFVHSLMVGMNWWNKADYYKQRGFYCGFHKTILQPTDLTFKDYDIAKKIATKFYENCNLLVTELNKLSEQELEHVLEGIKTPEFYTSFQTFINANRINK